MFFKQKGTIFLFLFLVGIVIFLWKLLDSVPLIRYRQENNLYTLTYPAIFNAILLPDGLRLKLDEGGSITLRRSITQAQTLQQAIEFGDIKSEGEKESEVSSGISYITTRNNGTKSKIVYVVENGAIYEFFTTKQELFAVMDEIVDRFEVRDRKDIY